MLTNSRIRVIYRAVEYYSVMKKMNTAAHLKNTLGKSGWRLYTTYFIHDEVLGKVHSLISVIGVSGRISRDKK